MWVVARDGGGRGDDEMVGVVVGSVMGMEGADY